MRIAVVGGGPGGLFAATLIKRSGPAHEVTVFERNRAEDTFGFGVVFSDATMAGIHAADPVLLTALTEHGVHWDAIEVRLHGERYRCEGNGMAAVERKTLLALLQRQAADEGVDVRFSTETDVDDMVDAGYDLVIASDGANSRFRERYPEVFGPSFDTATAKFIWLGTTYPFEGLTFVHERSPHGVFAVHGYPIGNGVSTFIVETDEPSWTAADLDEFDVTQPPGPSDEKSRAYLQQLFADQIDGHPLLVNNSRWGNFRTRRARCWRHRTGGTAIALLGDAAHTAHFSVGSGTKMAMEDAIALAKAVAAHPGDLDAALAEYEQVRRPQVEKIQDSARPSLSWWEHFGRSHDTLPGWQFAYHFFTRSLTDGKLRRRDPEFVEAAHACWKAAHGTAPLDSPLALPQHAAPGRLVTLKRHAVQLAGGPLPLTGEPAGSEAWGLEVTAPEAEADLAPVLDAVAHGVASGAALVAVRGGTPLTRRLICEEARLGHGVPALLIEDGDADMATTAVLSGRADLVAATEGANA
jgi:2-polyprenyl-6-methoxyphenol hydroxylase-like FAD-dependent oxidoreductase